MQSKLSLQVGDVLAFEHSLLSDHPWRALPEAGQVLPDLLHDVHGLDWSRGLRRHLDDHHRRIHFQDSGLRHGSLVPRRRHVDPRGLLQLDRLQTGQGIDGHLKQHRIKYLWHFGKFFRRWSSLTIQKWLSSMAWKVLLKKNNDSPYFFFWIKNITYINRSNLTP